MTLRFSSMRLLRGIYQETRGRNRGVRDVTKLDTGLTVDESQAAWRDLVDLGLIERFSVAHVARLSVAGLEFIENASSSDPAAPSGRVYIVHGHGNGARETVAEFAEQLGCEVILLHDRDEQGRAVIEQMKTHNKDGFAIVLLEEAPRLNVLLELGYFLGRFGEGKVCAMAVGGPVELQEDLTAVTLMTLDERGEWQKELAARLAGR
jgi:predicted nucleotide-binding protein